MSGSIFDAAGCHGRPGAVPADVTDPYAYTAVHGPRAGDRLRLGDSGLIVRVEYDAQKPGDEFLAGFGKTARDGLHLKAAAVRETCDLVISNVLVIDAVLGIRKTSIGVREGRIHAIGRAGNPDTLDGVEVVVGTGTTIVSGEGMIATAGAIDTHVHLLSPRIMEASLAAGVTTIIGQEFGPVWGVGVNSPWALRHAFNAFDAWPVNIGFLARGSSSDAAPLVEALAEGGASGFKVHEDMGAHTRALDTALRVAEEHDVQVALHSDGLNECLSVEDTLRVLDGRTIHAFHIEGCGGGHVPNVLKMAGVRNVIGSSTNPTLPFGRDALAEHFGMIVSAHDLKVDLPGDAAMARERIWAGTMGAEDVLHDLGVIGITSSDAQGMGRAGETVRRTFAMAGKMKAELGPLDGEGSYGNFYVANGGVVVPVAGLPSDEGALAVIAAALPGRKVVGVRSRVIAYGGGGVHCITQQVPLAEPAAAPAAPVAAASASAAGSAAGSR
ncbi:urease subunit alpha [Streptomyces goshikiensis]|uniref:urease subunit alpha n=1 Tax=Streptomyces goshikiensis TaxID=1942 RepID=UPI0036B5C12A